MFNDILSDLTTAISKAHDALKRDFTKIRTGRASTSMLDNVRVDYYGTSTPLSQMANVNVGDARLLLVKAWDKSQLKAIEKAIANADLGLNPQIDGDIIRIPIPSLNEERRRDLVKLARKTSEETKVAIRKARHDAIDMLNEYENDGQVSEDDAERGRKKIEDTVSDGIKQVDAILAHKEKDILEI